MSLEELLKTLQSDYVASLPKKIDEIQAQITARLNDDLRESFHKLKGTGRTYGLPEISVLAEVIEEICTDLPHQSARAASEALIILSEIHAARVQGQSVDLSRDPRLESLRKLLP